MGIERKRDESAYDYHKRIVYEKVLDKTLHEYDYSELSECVYGQSYSSDVARRMMYGSCKTLQFLDQCERESCATKSEMEMLEAQQIELQKERQRLQDQRREYRKLMSRDGRIEHVENCMIEAARNLEYTIGRLYGEQGEEALSAEMADAGADETEAVLVLTDWHYGAVSSNVWNTYNKDICIMRVKKIIEQTKQRMALHNCQTLHVVLLGDMVNGGIHTDARVMSDELVADQIMQVSEIIAQSIYELSCVVDKIFVYSTYGNHSRVIPSKNDSVHRDNFERFIPFWLKERFQNNQKIIVVPEEKTEFLHFYACGIYAFCATHGDLDNARNVGHLFPTLFQKRYGEQVDYVLLGHGHSRAEMENLGVETFVCGSLCGTDSFANEHRLYSSPEQLLMIVDPECGVDAVYRLKT